MRHTEQLWNVGNYRFCSENTNYIYGIEAWEIKVCSSLGKFWWALDQDIMSFHAFAVILASSPKGLTVGLHQYKSGQDAVLKFCGCSYFFTVARIVPSDKEAPPSTMLYHVVRQATSLYAISKSSPSWGRIVGLDLEAHIPFLPHNTTFSLPFLGPSWLASGKLGLRSRERQKVPSGECRESHK